MFLNDKKRARCDYSHEMNTLAYQKKLYTKKAATANMNKRKRHRATKKVCKQIKNSRHTLIMYAFNPETHTHTHSFQQQQKKLTKKKTSIVYICIRFWVGPLHKCCDVLGARQRVYIVCT